MTVVYELLNRDAVLHALDGAGARPAFGHVVADHVTYADDGAGPLPSVRRATAIGYAFGHGVDALVVDVDGALHRPDGKVFHLTLSLADGHEAGEAGVVAAAALDAGTVTPLPGIELDLRSSP